MPPRVVFAIPNLLFLNIPCRFYIELLFYMLYNKSDTLYLHELNVALGAALTAPKALPPGNQPQSPSRIRAFDYLRPSAMTYLHEMFLV